MGEHRDVVVAALMTAPRYESVWSRTNIERALHSAGVPLNISGGVFYGQCMQRMLEQRMDEGVEYALTVDFDSIFTAEHVRRLISIVVQEDDIDALAAIQPMRGKGRLLGTTGKAEEVVWTGEPIQVVSAHFGLTVIDLKKLKDVRKPWFCSVPNEDGMWNGDKVDDDVYFWRKWHEAGNTVYIDPGARLGHLEEMITVFDGDMTLKHIYPAQWEEQSGKTVD